MGALLLLIILNKKQTLCICTHSSKTLQSIRKSLTHIDGAREGLALSEHSESVIEASNVVFSLHLVGEEGFVALEGYSGVEFVHGESCGA